MSARVLIVDDDEMARSVLHKKLGECGYDVVEAIDGRQAVQLLREDTIDLVITDILMPEKDGLEIIMFLRKEQPEVKIIAITGAAPASYLDSARSLGASRTFRKPFKLEDLAAAVEDLLSA
ncbi:MAG: response regulator [Planctomycetes bacterium]|nr:response regulator [Planctomycetota bacterium]